MDEPEKAHSCDAPGCNMEFEDNTHLTVHKKKHEMVLNLGNGQKNTFVADQTPTPTRFIRNCEELGLFQDLQNVNPFEETFRKAVETGKTGYGALKEVEHLHVPAGSDDTLHTPHVFPYIMEDAPSSTSPVRAAISSLVSSSSGVVRSKSNASQVEARLPGENIKLEQAGGSANASALQLLLRMPDCKLVTLSNLQTASNGVHPTVLTFAPANPEPTQVPVPCEGVEPRRVDVAVKSVSKEPQSSLQPAQVSLAKLKLKEVLTGAAKARVKNNGVAVVNPLPSVMSIPRRPLNYESSKSADSQPSSTSFTKDRSTASHEDDAAERKRKFLERNRAAAMRCRQKRRSWVQELERRSRELETTNQHLQTEVASLRAEVAQLKTLLLAHKECPVTLALAQGARLTISSPSPQPQQVISMSVPVADPTRGTVPVSAASNRIVSPPTGLAAPTPVVILNSKSPEQCGVAPKRRRTFSRPETQVPSPQQSDKVVVEPVAKLVPAVSQGILVPSGPQIISVTNLQPSTTTYILTAAPRVEQTCTPLQVIKVNPNAAPPPPVRVADVDSDSDVELLGEEPTSNQPDS